MSEEINNSIMTLARQQVFDEYIKRKADDLSQWLIECDRVWKEEGTLLPYPSFSFYPAEEDIIERAKLLSKSVEKPKVIEKVEEPIEETEEVEEDALSVTPIPQPTKSVPVYYKKRRKWK